ncbi:MAG: DUF4124 domain-containing protein [Burkholderiaceae bacterium]|jgi:hypothetical protein|nr:DUF4124 domain-containing protein [Burkholderiaceae bacterium]
MKNSVRILLFGAALAASLAASAQSYQWIDKDGHRVFSDRAPPADVPAKNILSQPHGSQITETGAPTEQTGTPDTAQPAASAPSGTDQSLEDKKKQAEDAEAAKKKAEEDKIAAQKADNCKRAMNAKAGLETGVVRARTTAKGDREFFTDQERAAEIKRLQGIVASDCPQ